MDKQYSDTAQEAQALAQALSQSANATETLDTMMKKVQSTVKSTVKLVRSFLSDFDEIQRLPDKEVTVTTTVKENSTQLADGITDGSLAYRIDQFNQKVQQSFRQLQQQINMTNQAVEQLGFRTITVQNGSIKLLDQGVTQLLRPVEQWRTLQSGVMQALSGTNRDIRALLPDMERFQSISQQTNNTLGILRSRLSGGIFAGWKNLWDTAALTVRAGVNDMIRSVNTLMTGVGNAYSAVAKISAVIPGGTQLPHISVPKIPYLAQGAVLPANQPFLAVVGDQTHGTNIEAPLATIQEAVAAVTGEQTGAIMAGFEASVGVQKEILEAVLGIRIGDDTIAGAVRRYEQKMAVVRGG